ncbi:MAG: type I-B CRISPR-associated protein Cas5 [Bacteroidota bacterium]|nr:type I-B CRISPR-associated protein Cas5 [Bacteroidota bacterium]
MKKLISFDLKADFGFLKKPDINENEIFITFNSLHKPALLGILGAIAGLKGYEKYGVLPEYYIKLKDIKTGIRPLNSDKGIFQKTMIKYNNATGFANKDATEKFGETLNVTEQTLISPFFKCYVELDDEDELQKNLITNILNLKSTFIPYLGKNEYTAWWENPKTNLYKVVTKNDSVKIDTIFTKTGTINEQIEEEDFNIFNLEDSNSMFMYFERLPIGFFNLGENIYQYELKSFVYTNRKLKKDTQIENLYEIDNGSEIIQLF